MEKRTGRYIELRVWVDDQMATDELEEAAEQLKDDLYDSVFDDLSPLVGAKDVTWEIGEVQKS